MKIFASTARNLHRQMIYVQDESGEYIFRLEKDGYQTEDIKVDLIKIAQVYVTVNLKSKK